MKLPQRRLTAPSLGAVFATRQGSLLLAALCAVIAAAVLLFALARFKANVAKPVPQASVLVATGEIQSGTTGASIARRGLYKLMPVAADQVSVGAIASASALTNATAATDILPGQQLTTADFATIVDAGQVLKRGQRALELDVSGAPGAIDITQPGSRVDIWTKAVTGKEVLLVSDVLVLKPATATPVTIGNQSVGGSSLVLALDDSIVPKVIKNLAGLYLVLRPSRSDPQAAAAAAASAPATATTATAAAATVSSATTTTGGQG